MGRPGGTSSGWRRPAAVLALAAIVALGVWGWRARATVPERDVIAAARPPAPAPPTAVAPPSARTPSNVVVPYVAPPRPKAVAAVGAQAAAEYRRRARYPRWAQPLTQ